MKRTDFSIEVLGWLFAGTKCPEYGYGLRYSMARLRTPEEMKYNSGWKLRNTFMENDAQNLPQQSVRLPLSCWHWIEKAKLDVKIELVSRWGRRRSELLPTWGSGVFCMCVCVTTEAVVVGWSRSVTKCMDSLSSQVVCHEWNTSTTRSDPRGSERISHHGTSLPWGRRKGRLPPFSLIAGHVVLHASAVARCSFLDRVVIPQ